MPTTISGSTGLNLSGSGNQVTFPDSSVQTTSATGFGFKNRIINGAMVIDQRNAGASVTPANAAVTYTLDRYAFYVNQASKLTVQQSTTVPTGFKNSMVVTSSSAYSSGASDVFVMFQSIEGLNVSDFGWGAVGAQSITISFWFRSSLTGTHSGAISNSGNTRSYPFTFTVSAANTWEYETITIAGDTSGTWLTTNGTGLTLKFNCGSGSTALGTAGAWAAADYSGATGSVSLVGTSGATFYVTGVQLEKGSTATSFDYRPYGTELVLCQRYCNVYGGASIYETVGYGSAISGGSVDVMVPYPVQMRTSPTLSISGSFQLSDGVGASTIFVLSLVSAQTGTKQVSLNATSSGLTTYRPYRIESANNTTAKLTFSAEL
jgi:hypothetical protein